MLLAWVIVGLERLWTRKAATGSRLENSTPSPTGALHLSQISSGGRNLLYAVLTWFAVQLFATLLSINPELSFWGSYPRLQGLFTQLVYLLAFLSVLVLARHPDRRQRLVTVALMAGLPVALYGIIQHLGRDPLPWENVVVQRVISSIGNPILSIKLISAVITKERERYSRTSRARSTRPIIQVPRSWSSDFGCRFVARFRTDRN